MADTTELNKSYFNNEAAQYDTKHEKSLQQLTEAIQARLDLIGADWVNDDDDDDEPSDSDPKQVRLLDYACGTGMVSRALAPYTTQCVGVDISENMVAHYNARAENQGLTKDDMYAVVGDLTVPEDPKPASLAGPEFFDFELAAVGGGLHHFDNPELTITRLVERLRQGGVVFIWDFLTHEGGGDHPALNTVRHHGFSEDQVRTIFEKAGAGKNFAMEELGSGVVFGHNHNHNHSHGHGHDHGHGHGHGGEGKHLLKRRAFIARGEKA